MHLKQNPSTGLCYISALGTRHSALGTRHSALGTRHSALGTRHSATLFRGSACIFCRCRKDRVRFAPRVLRRRPFVLPALGSRSFELACWPLPTPYEGFADAWVDWARLGSSLRRLTWVFAGRRFVLLVTYQGAGAKEERDHVLVDGLHHGFEQSESFHLVLDERISLPKGP